MSSGRYRFTVLQLLLVTAWIGIVLAWRVASHRAFRGIAGWCRSVAFSPDGRTLAAGITNQLPPRFEVRLWDVEAGEPTGSLTQHDYVVESVAFSPDGTTLAAACIEIGDPFLWQVGLRSDHWVFMISGFFFGAAWIWLLRRQSAKHAA